MNAALPKRTFTVSTLLFLFSLCAIFIGLPKGYDWDYYETISNIWGGLSKEHLISTLNNAFRGFLEKAFENGSGQMSMESKSRKKRLDEFSDAVCLSTAWKPESKTAHPLLDLFKKHYVDRTIHYDLFGWDETHRFPPSTGGSKRSTLRGWNMETRLFLFSMKALLAGQGNPCHAVASAFFGESHFMTSTRGTVVLFPWCLPQQRIFIPLHTPDNNP